MVQPEPKNHPSGDALIEILHVELLSAGGEVHDEVRR